MNNRFKEETPRRFNSRAGGEAGIRRSSRGASARQAAEATRASLPLSRAVEYWMDAARAEGRSAATLTVRRHWMGCVIWWLAQEGIAPNVDALTPGTIRRLLAYAREANPKGRWGNDRPNSQREAKPATVEGLCNTLRSFCAFCAKDELMEAVPFTNIRVPMPAADPIRPFTPEQVQDLLDAASRGRNPERDRAIITFLVDTGLRVSELCSLTMGDINESKGELSVVGKGRKRRTVYMQATARRFLWRYLTLRDDADELAPVFLNEAGRGLEPQGVAAMLERAGKGAGIEGVRCSPHTLRHTFAVSYLRGGGNVLELQRLLGHKSLEMTNRYVLLADMDLSRAHRLASPADRMKLK